MFTEKSNTEIITINDEVKIVGINLQNSGLPMSFESLGALWGIYREKYRYNVKNAIVPGMEYAVCLNKIPDYIAGCAVTETDDLEEGWLSFILPKGKYIKDSFNAETFHTLTTDVMGKRDVKSWAKKNNTEIDETFSIEVYPIEAVEGKNVEMYTLTPIKE